MSDQANKEETAQSNFSQQPPRSYYIYEPISTKSQQKLITNNTIGNNDLINQMVDQAIDNEVEKNDQANVTKSPNQSTLQHCVFMNKNPCTFIYDNKMYIINSHINHKQLRTISTKGQQQNEFTQSITTRQSQHLPIQYISLQSNRFYRQDLTIINYQLIQRSYQIYSPLSRTKHSSPAQSTRNRQPKIYFPIYLQNLSCSQLIQNKHIVYVFGGVYRQTLQYSNMLWRINMRLKTIQLIKQQGEQIQQRQAASLISFNSNYIVLYGGYNITTCTVYNDFYCLNTLTSTWYIIQTQFQNLLTPRIHPIFTYNENNHMFYLFGGMLHDYHGNMTLLNDMYQLELTEISDSNNSEKKNKKYKGLLKSKTILQKIYHPYPPKRAGHQICWLTNQIMLMIGGQKQYQIKGHQQQQQSTQNIIQNMYFHRSYHNDIWLFDTSTSKWTQLLAQNSQVQIRGNAYFVLQFCKKVKDGIYEVLIFGGQNVQQQNGSKISNNNISRIKIDMRLYQQWKKQSHKNGKKMKQQCNMCLEMSNTNNNTNSHTNSNSNNKGRIDSISSNIIDNIILTNMKFPFTAFGLLAHYSIQRQSSIVAITYKQFLLNTQQQNQIAIEDAGQLQYKAQQISNKIHLLGNKDMTDILGVTDKKYKTMHLREYNVSQFCNQLKIAGLRLGQEIFWIGNNAYRQTLVFLLRKQTKHKENNNMQMKNINKAQQQKQNNNIQNINFQYKNNNQQKQQNPSQTVYRTYFYAIDRETYKLLPGYQQSVRNEVMKSYSQIIKYFNKQSQSIGSMMRIKKLRKISVQNIHRQKQMKYQLTPLAEKNTIIIENQLFNSIKNLQLKNLAFQQSIDINLTAYLSVLFLNRSTSLLLKVNSFVPQKPILPNKQLNIKQIHDADKNKIEQAVKQVKKQVKKNNFVLFQMTTGQKQVSLKQMQSQQKKKNMENNKYKEVQQQKRQGQINIKKQTSERKSSFIENVARFIEKHPKQSLLSNHPHLLKQPLIVIDYKEPLERKKSQILLKQSEKYKQKYFQKQKHFQKQKQRQRQFTKTILKQTFNPATTTQARQIVNSFYEIPAQFMLPKIDLLKAKQQLVDIDLDTFGEFDCKTIEVYFWKNKQNYINNNFNLEKHQKKMNQSNSIDLENDVSIFNVQNKKQSARQKDQPTLLFPNGILIYYKNRLIKRYNPPLGVFNPFLKSPVSNIIGAIQINQKIPVNVFSTAFINEEIQLQDLYARIQHIAYLFNKMHSNNKIKRSKGMKNDEQIKNKNDKQQQQMVNLSVVNKQEIIQETEGTKRVKLN